MNVRESQLSFLALKVVEKSLGMQHDGTLKGQKSEQQKGTQIALFLSPLIIFQEIP